MIPRDGLLAEYLFRGNADDSSGHGRHGAVHGAALVADRFGNADAAYQFDGVDDHIYGTLKRNVVSITGRATYAFTRDMTLEVYLQPFVAAGDYTDIRRFVQPKTFTFEPAPGYTDNPDFNNKSLRSNTVLRWEYKPGSTIFAVWNVATSDAARPGLFSPLQDLGRAFAADGTHVFMIKMNYWLGL